MILPNHGSSISQDSSLNMTPWDNFYILGYKGPNEISQYVQYSSQTLISMVKFSDPECETLTRGNLYKFAMLNIT